MSKQESKKSKREAARAARLEAQKAREKARKRKKMMRNLLIVLLAGALVGFIVFRSRESDVGVKQLAKSAGCVEKEHEELDAAPHIEDEGSTPKYNSNPPSSGLHFGRTAPWGTSSEKVDDRLLVHNLEHGGVIVHYKDLPDDQVDQLEEMVDSYPDGVVGNPNPDIESKVALAAWGNVMTCKSFSESVAKAFIKEHCNKGPEKLGLGCAG